MRVTLSLFIHLLFLIFFISNPALAVEDPWDLKLPFEKATIKYTVSGSINGTETLYIADYGKKRAHYHKTTQKIMFVTTHTDEIEIITPDWIYTIDMTKNSGAKVVNPQKFMFEEYNKLSLSEKQTVDTNIAEVGMSSLHSVGGQIEENAETILGYSCDRVKLAGSTVYSIHGTDIFLKTETNIMGGTFSAIATSIEEGPIEHNVFEPPPGISIVHDQRADKVAHTMAKKTIDMMKSPDAAEKMDNYDVSIPQHHTEELSAGENVDPPAHQDNQGMGQDINKAMDALKGLWGN